MASVGAAPCGGGAVDASGGVVAALAVAPGPPHDAAAAAPKAAPADARESTPRTPAGDRKRARGAGGKAGVGPGSPQAFYCDVCHRHCKDDMAEVTCCFGGGSDHLCSLVWRCALRGVATAQPALVCVRVCACRTRVTAATYSTWRRACTRATAHAWPAVGPRSRSSSARWRRPCLQHRQQRRREPTQGGAAQGSTTRASAAFFHALEGAGLLRDVAAGTTPLRYVRRRVTGEAPAPGGATSQCTITTQGAWGKPCGTR